MLVAHEPETGAQLPQDEATYAVAFKTTFYSDNCRPSINGVVFGIEQKLFEILNFSALTVLKWREAFRAANHSILILGILHSSLYIASIGKFSVVIHDGLVMMPGDGIGYIRHELVPPALCFEAMPPGVVGRDPFVGQAEATNPRPDHPRAIASSLAEPIMRQVRE